MFRCVMRITPQDSSSIEYLEWDSVAGVLTVCYTNSDKCYDLEGVDWNALLELESLAYRLRSWGKALHRWKSDRSLMFASQARRRFEDMWNSLHPDDKKRYASWAREELLSEAAQRAYNR